MEFATCIACALHDKYPQYVTPREGTSHIRVGGLSENAKTELGQKRQQGACNGYTVKVIFHKECTALCNL